jgi:hypothetical protein
MVQIGRNTTCPCGSGLKYKKCCGDPLKEQRQGLGKPIIGSKTNNSTETLFLESSEGPIKLDRTDILFFFDETGDEGFLDPKFPLFGLGGVGSNVGYYVDTIRPAWHDMKDRFFSGADSIFHAADLRTPTPGQVGALAQFFEKFQTLRVAAVTTDQTGFGKDIIPIQATAICLQQRMLSVLKYQHKFSKLYLLFEENPRIERDIDLFFSDFRELDADGTKIPVVGAFMPKTAVEPGLEIADTIMHTTGAQVRNRLKEKLDKPDRKDWTSVWRSMPDQLCSYLEITKIE